MNDLRNHKVQKVVATLITNEGDYTAQITRFEFINSFEKNFEHEEKEGVREDIETGKMWVNPTSQIAVTFGDKEGNGVITHRFNGNGWLKASDPEVTDKMLEKEDVLVIKGYVCKQDKEGHFERIESIEKTEKAINMIHSFINKLGITDETVSFEQALKTALNDKYLINISVIEDTYEGKDRLIIDKFTKISLDDVDQEEEPAVNQSDFDDKEKAA